MTIDRRPGFAGTALLVCWGAAVAWLTLRPDPAAQWAADLSPPWCLACGEIGGADLVLNLLLFAPLGVGLRLLDAQRRTALLLGLVFSLAIEVTQGTLIPGRDATLGDLVANSLGACTGFSLTAWWRSLARLPPNRAAGAGLVLWVTILAGSAWLLQPRLAGPTPWVSRGPGEFPGRPTFTGHVVAARIGGARPSAPLPPPFISGDPATEGFDISLAWGTPASGVSTPVIRLEDAAGDGLMSLSVTTSDLRGSLAIRGGLLRLRTPSWVVPVGAVSADDEVRVHYTWRPGAGTVRVTTPGNNHEERLRVGAQHGWLLLNPFSPGRAGTAWDLWTMAWLSAWGALLGITAARARSRWWWLIASLAALLIISAASGSLPRPLEPAAFLAGWLAGLSAARPRRQPGGA